MVALNSTISVIKLIPNEKGKIVTLHKKETNFKYKYKDRLKVKEWGNIDHYNTNQKKTRLDLLISDKVRFRAMNITRAKERHFILINT